MYWRLISRVRRQVGRKQTPKEVRELIFRMVAENPTWGAPRIHGELLMLGFDLSERTISRWRKQAPKDSDRGKHLLAFLRNHREAIAAMDFFTMPTITFGVLYCFFVISHDRRRILHVNVTKHPRSAWIIQQLREAFPFEASHKYLIFDRDQKFGFEVIAAVQATRIIPKRTSFRSPWQNGVAERWVGSCRRDLLDHMVALNERHLKRLGMFVTIMRTVRISDLRRGHLRGGLVPWLQVGFFPRSESAGCTIVTIEPPSPDRLSAGPLYMCAPRALGFVPFRVLVFMPYRAIIVYRPTLPGTALFLVQAEVLANQCWSRARVVGHCYFCQFPFFPEEVYNLIGCKWQADGHLSAS